MEDKGDSVISEENNDLPDDVLIRCNNSVQIIKDPLAQLIVPIEKCLYAKKANGKTKNTYLRDLHEQVAH
ncbi:hypothetical protein NQ317_011450 [Molorchus minor]|uniref:Uncharacterized protein n=1 Tax=Molorchus minor TaxID=1323400 RepID=A0ABQ9IUY5_9CUCU|nr:hypothetical protein NQ317_011450 [Molorchus minor]